MVAKKTDNELRTRCPECQTVLRVDREQLARRNGVARCGRCATVFLAEKYAVVTAPKPAKPAAPAKPKKAAGTSPAAAVRKAPTPTKRPPPPVERAPVGEPETTAPQTAEELEEMLDEARRSLFGEPAPRTHPFYWTLAIAITLILLVGQFTYFNRTELARYPELKPAVLGFCRALGCEIAPRRNVALIDLTKSTIAPHPAVRQTLRIRIAMVNRAKFAQPYPLLEVSFSDSAGQLLARRSFKPAQYLTRADKAGAEMAPSVLVNGLIDVANPDNKAVGYELRLVTS